MGVLLLWTSYAYFNFKLKLKKLLHYRFKSVKIITYGLNTEGVVGNMNILMQIITNPVLIVPACSWIIAQVLKSIISAIMNKKFSFDRLVGDGGMPSGHSATVTSLAVMCGIVNGFDSAVFGLATIFAIVVMHDATGVRREAGKHARSIISIIEVLEDYLFENDDVIKTDKLKVLVGHTPLQVVVGSALGIAIAVCYYFFFM